MAKELEMLEKAQTATVTGEKPSQCATCKREVREIKSTYALDQLTMLAERSTRGEFVLFMVNIFGHDIPAHTYIKLYDALRAKTVPNPEHVLSDNTETAHFNSKTRKIHVSDQAARRAVSDPEDYSWHVLEMLLHEFGHYIDHLLRHDYADKDKDGNPLLAKDAPHEEGQEFAYCLAFVIEEGKNETVYAYYKTTLYNYDGPLKVDYTKARKLVMESQAGGKNKKEAPRSGGNREFSDFA